MYFIYKVICKCRSGFWLWRGGHVDLTLRASMEPAASPGARSWSLNTFLMSRRIHHSLPLTGCLLLLYLLFLIFILLTWLHWVLVVACGILVVGSISLSWDQTWSASIGSSESEPLDHRGSPCFFLSHERFHSLLPRHQGVLRHIILHSWLGSCQCF